MIRVNQQLALLSDADLPDGAGWKQFAAIDLWQALTFKSPLANIIQDQARRLPRVVFREVAG